MKVIITDNYDRETVSDVLLCENVTPFNARRIAKAMNQVFSGNHSDEYFQAVEDDYVLQVYDPR